MSAERKAKIKLLWYKNAESNSYRAYYHVVYRGPYGLAVDSVAFYRDLDGVYQLSTREYLLRELETYDYYCSISWINHVNRVYDSGPTNNHVIKGVKMLDLVPKRFVKELRRQLVLHSL